MPSILTTPRLRLRENTPGDHGFLAELLGDAEVMRFWPRPFTADEAAAWIEQQHERQRDRGYGYWLAELRETGECVGQIGVLPQEVEGRWQVGLGWIVHKPFWRRGLATEGAVACLAWALANTDASRVIALIRPENEPSQGVARKLGLTRGERVEYKTFAHDVWYQSR